MFKKILVALDHSKADQALLGRVTELARLAKAELVLVHVATGWAAQWQEDLNLTDSQEVKDDREFLETIGKELRRQGFQVTTRHAVGKPAEEILKAASEENCDLIAMASHGHRLISDVIYGTTITKVRHETDIPLFLIKAAPE
jgi:nucleotide-binding universal stress UspA family protein